MWKKRPAHDLIAGWIEHASELSDAGSPARARALIARAYLDPDEEGAAAREATETAERLDDLELRSWAWGARLEEAMARGAFDEAHEWATRRFDLVPTLDDPDHIALIYVFGTSPCLATLRFDEADEIARAHDEVTARLTPHHRMHAAALLLDPSYLRGRWEEVRRLRDRTEAAVEANSATPCAANFKSLMACGVAAAHLGDQEDARRLRRSADALGMEGYRFEVDRVELALALGELDRLKEIVASWRPDGFLEFDGVAAWLDALVALERRDEIEREAPPFQKPGSYLEPFVLRSLGFARGEEALVRQAIGRFDEVGMSWHAEDTRRLLPST
jgi:hypothetical protein